jgi:hypothetical protein
LLLSSLAACQSRKLRFDAPLNAWNIAGQTGSVTGSRTTSAWTLHVMDDGARVANDQVLITLVSMCVLHDRFHLNESSIGREAAHETQFAVRNDATDLAVCG